MRLEREIKKVYEPLRGGGWSFNLTPPREQDIEIWIREYSNLTHRAYVEVVRYV